MTLTVAWLLVPDGLAGVFQKLLISLDFHTQQSLDFTHDLKNKHPIPWMAVL